MNRNIYLCMLAGGLLCSSVSAQITKSKAGYLFRVKYVKGQTVRLRTTNTIDNKQSPSAKAVMTVNIDIKVLSIKNGVAVTQMTMGPSMLNGAKVMNGSSTTVALDDRNQTPNSSTTTNLGPPLPKKPMKIGTTWKAVTPINVGTGIQQLEGNYRFIGFKTVAGRQLAVITYELTGIANGTGVMMLGERRHTYAQRRSHEPRIRRRKVHPDSQRDEASRVSERAIDLASSSSKPICELLARHPRVEKIHEGDCEGIRFSLGEWSREVHIGDADAALYGLTEIIDNNSNGVRRLRQRAGSRCFTGADRPRTAMRSRTARRFPRRHAQFCRW